MQLTGPSSGDGGAEFPRPPPMAGRLPSIMLPYKSPPLPPPPDADVPARLLPPAPRLDTSGVVVVVEADEATLSIADWPMFTGGRLPGGGGSPDMFGASAAAAAAAAAAAW